MAKLTHLRNLRVEFLGGSSHSILGSRDSWTRYFDRLAPVNPHLTRLDSVCGRAYGDGLIDNIDEPTCFDKFAALRHLEVPSEAIDVIRPLPKVLPSSLEHLFLHTVSEEVLVWLTGLSELGWEFRALRQVTLDTRGWWRRYEDHRLYTMHCRYSYALRGLNVSLRDAGICFTVCHDDQCSLEWPEPEHRKRSLEDTERG